MHLNAPELLQPVFDFLDGLIRDYGDILFMLFTCDSVPRLGVARRAAAQIPGKESAARLRSSGLGLTSECSAINLPPGRLSSLTSTASTHPPGSGSGGGDAVCAKIMSMVRVGMALTLRSEAKVSKGGLKSLGETTLIHLADLEAVAARENKHVVLAEIHTVGDWMIHQNDKQIGERTLRQLEPRARSVLRANVNG